MPLPHERDRSAAPMAANSPTAPAAPTDILLQDETGQATPWLAACRAAPVILLTDLGGAIVDCNGAVEKCFGYRRGEIVGKPVSLLVPADSQAQHAALFHAAARGVMASLAESTCRRRDGAPLSVSWTVAPMRDGAGNLVGAVAIAYDLTEIHRLERQWRQAQTMDIFGQLARGIAHDFNNLLTIMLGYTEIIGKRITPGDPLRPLLKEIDQAGRRAEALTRQLLALKRTDPLTPMRVDLNAAVAEAENLVRRLLGDNLHVTTVLAPVLKPIRIDPDFLRQIILHLAASARDAMPTGGTLTIETDDIPVGEADAGTSTSETLVSSSAHTLISSSEALWSASEAADHRLFAGDCVRLVVRAAGARPATGPGLPAVHDMVKQCGGHFHVHAAPGQDLVFQLFLPAFAEPGAVPEPNPRVRMIPPGRETVLLLEDDDRLRSLLHHVLQACGYTVLEAADGDAAVRLAERHAGPIDLLLADVGMPRPGARPFVARVLAHRPRLKVLFLSGYSTEASERHGLAAADFDSLQKPFTTGVLAQKVRDVLDQPPTRPGA